MWIQLLVQVQGFDDAVVIVGGFLHGGEVGEEGRLHEVLKANQALAYGDFFRRGEFLGGAEDVDEEVSMVRGAIAHHPGIVEGNRGVAGLRKQGFVDARRDEVLTTAQQQRGDGRRIGVRGGGGRFRGGHGIVSRRFALRVCFVK